MEGYEKLDPEKWRAYESALIKSIRRCKVDDAVYWSAVLWQYGKAKKVWTRLLIHCSEDIGIADINIPANVRALYENWKQLSDQGHKDGARLSYTHAVILMAKANKSRIVDNAVIYYYQKPLEDRPVPDEAFDLHGRVGRDLGRGVQHFFDEGAKLANEYIADPYRDQALEVALAKETSDK